MRTLRARLPDGPDSYERNRIGWLTPMLGIFTLLNVLLVWGNAFGLQKVLPVGYDTWTLGLLLCSFYYYAAGMIFPGDPRVWPDVDDWFWLHRRQVLGCILVANIPFWLADYFVWDQTRSELIVTSIVIALLASMMLVAIFSKVRWLVTVALSTLIRCTFPSFHWSICIARESGSSCPLAPKPARPRFDASRRLC